MNPSLYVGHIRHERKLPKKHRFSYPFFMWFLNLDELEKLNSLGVWFSTTRFALSRFYRPDYYGDPQLSLADAIRLRMLELTGHPVEGMVCSLMNMRTLGIYFSPVNFYYGYNREGVLTHFLAEVSNTPWNERHQYAHYLPVEGYSPENSKSFQVSPFNHLNQHYRWQLTPPEKQVSVEIKVDDDRGHIFTARLELERRPFEARTVRKELVKKPVMTLYILAAIYWQALRLFMKGVPFIPYTKEVL